MVVNALILNKYILTDSFAHIFPTVLHYLHFSPVNNLKIFTGERNCKLLKYNLFYTKKSINSIYSPLDIRETVLGTQQYMLV